MPPTPGYHKSARDEPLSSHPNLAQNIAVFEIAFGEFQHGRIVDRPDFQPSDIGAARGRCRGGCARSDYIDQVGVVRLTCGDQKSPKQDACFTLPRLHSATR